MASKKYKLLLIGVFTLLTIGVYAQQGGTYDVYDSSVISPKGMTQANEFWNNTYSFPAKPRNQLEVGISAGLFSLSSDVSARIPTPGFGVHIRKALGYVFSLRAQFNRGTARGLNWNSSTNYAKNKAWASTYAAPFRNQVGTISYTVPGRVSADQIFYNYETKVNELALQGIVTLNNIRFHKQKSGMVIYAGTGFSAIAYRVFINTTDDANGKKPYSATASGGTNLFASIPVSAQNYKDHKILVLKPLKAGMDKTYETKAEAQGTRRGKIFKDNTLRFGADFIGGIAFKLSKRINLAIEEKYTVTKDDLLDGQRWQEHPQGDAVLTRDYDSYNYLSLGLNFNLGAKAVEPLWWINPLDYAYSELNNPRHMKLPKPTFDDADGDGVLDQLDKEPNTPAGCPVDTHGVTKDTDGDGVPDCKDKQLITPTECQPVDADGVGKCPEPDCCKNRPPDVVVDNTCKISDLPSISFKGNTPTLSSDARAMLATVASTLRGNANCAITVTGYPTASKQSQAVCNKRVEAIRSYLIEKEGISGDRITTNCEVGGGDANTVDIRAVNK